MLRRQRAFILQVSGSAPHSVFEHSVLPVRVFAVSRTNIGKRIWLKTRSGLKKLSESHRLIQDPFRSAEPLRIDGLICTGGGSVAAAAFEMLRVFCSCTITPSPIPARGYSYAFQTESEVTLASYGERSDAESSRGLTLHLLDAEIVALGCGPAEKEENVWVVGQRGSGTGSGLSFFFTFIQSSCENQSCARVCVCVCSCSKLKLLCVVLETVGWRPLLIPQCVCALIACSYLSVPHFYYVLV